MHSYEDFLKQAKAAGLLSSFSEADLRLAAAKPEAGLSILSFKQDYQNASTDEARALANAGAEQVRRRYGGYLGGTDGSQYIPVGADYGYVNQMENAETAAASAQREANAAGERLWADYRKQYLREGERAYQNSLGEAAANTGGIASTAAVAAAQQAQNYYGAKAADAKTALFQQAYENVLAEYELGIQQGELGVKQGELGVKQGELGVKQSSLDIQREQLGLEQKKYEQELESAKEQQTAAQVKAQAEAEQQRFENAMAKWKAYGYVTEDIAEVLSLPVGAAYTEQAYNEWKQAFEEAKSGVTTNRTQYDTVNLGERAAKELAAEHSTLNYGENSLEVQTMQRYLIALGYSCGSSGADGQFGTATHRALLRFQKDKGVYADGVCGPVTWTALLEAVGA